MMFSGKVCRRFVSGTTVLGFGLALASVGAISGCSDSDKSAGQVENPVDPAQKAKDSMDFYKKSQIPKSKKGVNR